MDTSCETVPTNYYLTITTTSTTVIIFYVYKTIAGDNITVQETKSHLAPGRQE